MILYLTHRVTKARRGINKVNQRLRESEEKFRLIFEEAPIGVALVALDGRFVRVNRVLCEIVGYSAEELEKLKFQDITHPEDVETDVTLTSKLAAGEIPRYQLEKRYIRKSGDIVDILLSVSLLRSADGPPKHYIVRVEDITERKHAEAVVQRLAAVTQDSNDAMTVQDFSGHILAWNPSAERMYGYSEGEALEMNIAAIVPEGDTKSLEYLEAIRHGGRIASAEVRRRTKDGKILDVWLTTTPLLEKGVPVAVATTERDITERRQTEIERQRDLDALDRLYHISSLFLGDQPPQAILHEILDAAIAIAGADFGNIQLLDPSSSDLEVVVHRGLPDWWLKFWAGVVKGHGACGTALQAGGRVVVEDVTQSPIFVGSEALDVQLRAGIRAVQSTPLVSGRTGKTIGMLSTHWKQPHRPPAQVLRLLDLVARTAADMVERLQTEEAQRRLEEQLRRAVQMRDDVLGIVAHDLRNPLGTIRLQASALARRGAEPERRNQRPKKIITRAVDRMEHLIRGLAGCGSIGAGTVAHQ